MKDQVTCPTRRPSERVFASASPTGAFRTGDQTLISTLPATPSSSDSHFPTRNPLGLMKYVRLIEEGEVNDAIGGLLRFLWGLTLTMPACTTSREKKSAFSPQGPLHDYRRSSPSPSSFHAPSGVRASAGPSERPISPDEFISHDIMIGRKEGHIVNAGPILITLVTKGQMGLQEWE
ncbi:hypothetical protein E2C01_001055 [Portunus trituberculatus]|uniref:Uncharacterized protein n=1 Tax=Portunus trituberculatus TaxID=210409 RepID=A0A5B7CGW7_PORTR|nr:hypothetical protein [Portunus trituberculatus]